MKTVILIVLAGAFVGAAAWSYRGSLPQAPATPSAAAHAQTETVLGVHELMKNVDCY